LPGRNDKLPTSHRTTPHALTTDPALVQARQDFTHVFMSWRAVMNITLLQVTNSHRAAEGKPLLPGNYPVEVGFAPQLLNWKVWCGRYHVDCAFILDFLLFKHLAFVRRVGDKRLTLGLSTLSLTGGAARQALNNHIVETYPNGENKHADQQALVRRIAPHDVVEVDYGSPDQMMSAYGVAMRGQPQTVKFSRPWRGRP